MKETRGLTFPDLERHCHAVLAEVTCLLRSGAAAAQSGFVRRQLDGAALAFRRRHQRGHPVGSNGREDHAALLRDFPAETDVRRDGEAGKRVIGSESRNGNGQLMEPRGKEVAERVGFEPTVALRLHTLSRRA